MLAKARDAQATAMRELRAQLDAATAAPHPAEAERDRWTGAALELMRLMEPGHYTGDDGTELRAALIAAVRRQLARVEAIGGRLGREEQEAAEQRRRAEAAETARESALKLAETTRQAKDSAETELRTARERIAELESELETERTDGGW
jgi:chromosome segregation ATPase